MSNRLQNKMYNYEIIPPQQVWDKIAVALDEAEADKIISTRLLNAEIIPPQENWMAVEQELLYFDQDKKVKEELYDLAVTPPDIWNKINTALEESSAENKVAGKLKTMEVWPPEKNWKQIETELDKKSAAKVLPLYNWRRIAAAVAILGAIVTGAVFFLNYNGNNQGETAEVTPPVNNTAEIEPAKSADAGTSPPALKNTGTETASSNTEEIKMPVSPRQVRKESPVTASFIPSEKEHTKELLQGNTAHKIHKAVASDPENATAALDNRYYLLLNSDGEIVKVSKKLDVMQCVLKSGLDIPLDETDEKTRQCNEQVKEWHEKLIKAPMISALDITSVIAEK